MNRLKNLLGTPLFWGLLYILAIPVYALIFEYLLPTGSFFHATLPHEPMVQARSRMLLQKLWDEYSILGPNSYGECKALSPFAKPFNVTSLTVEGDDVSFSANYDLGVWPKSYQVEPRIHFSLERNFDLPYRVPPGRGRGMVFKELRIDGLGTSAWGNVSPGLIARCLFPTLYDQWLPKNVVLLEISTQLNEEIHELASDLRGVPQSKSGGFGRMFYLSASTITTAGFGDIVPLTVLARTLVTSESILGVVFAGFFFYSIARRSR